MALVHPRIHILGTGGIGSLFAYHFHKHGIPWTALLRRPPNTKEGHPSLSYMDCTALDKRSAEPKHIERIAWEPTFPLIDQEVFSNDLVYQKKMQQPIHQLLVATKAYQTVDALSRIKHRLRPWSTIVLMQNGMGIKDEVCRAMGWHSARDRPNFVQGIISHGARRTDSTVVHTGQGTVWISACIDTIAQSSSDILRPKRNHIFDERHQTPNNPYPTLRPLSSSLRSVQYPSDWNPAFVSPFVTPSVPSYLPLSDDKEIARLRTKSLHETLANFCRLSTDLSLRLVVPADLLARQLQKLVVNSCLNPIGTLLQVPNGELQTPKASAVVKALLAEAHGIIIQSEEYQLLPPEQQATLTLDKLTDTTFQIIRDTQSNYNSTLQDYRNGSPQSELDYMNGTLIKMAQQSGASAELNTKVRDQVGTMFSSPR
ncbi:hypothetical protein DFQ27_002825 [Actinomortierella ambigua]|uniref:2-dehydropantoate 2-reductase n=1 Tax=Actinomortierella ambigua TaxID=1343610 RepID=A0A9P6Q9B5_9FUNG|nr:hypothetical protein DFQ27_002825 [Actinomortierella ambigua]